MCFCSSLFVQHYVLNAYLLLLLISVFNYILLIGLGGRYLTFIEAVHFDNFAAAL